MSFFETNEYSGSLPPIILIDVPIRMKYEAALFVGLIDFFD
jgi:hypothetical protein